MRAVGLNGGYKYRTRIGAREAGLSVLGFLSRMYRHSSKAEWFARIARGMISIDGEPVSADRLLASGEEIVWHRPPWEEPDVPLAYAVLYEDEDLLAVAKPSGLPTVAAGGFLEHTLLALVRGRYPEAVPAHRLGRGTSGVVLFARSARARKALAAAWRTGAVEKIYRALVSGHPSGDVFTVDVPIGPVPHPVLGSVHAASARGKPALSRARVIERRGGTSLLEVRIETGRPHQIRIHMAAAGHPLAGDPLYAAGGGIGEGCSALPGDVGYNLHHMRLALAHPGDGSSVEFSCLPPGILRAGGVSEEGGTRGGTL